MTSTVHAEPEAGPAPLSVVEDIDVGDSGSGERVAVAIGVGVTVAVGLRVRVAVSVGVVVVGERVVVTSVVEDRAVVVLAEVEGAVAVEVGDVELVGGVEVAIAFALSVEGEGDEELAVDPSVPAEPPHPARTTTSTRESAENERRIEYLSAQSAIKFPTVRMFQQRA